MYKNRRIILIAPAYNEEQKIGNVVNKTQLDVVDKILVVDDGSTDKTAQVAHDAGAEVVSLGDVKGVGYAIRRGYEIARKEGFDIAVVIAGNDKDNPGEIQDLLDPICNDDYDFTIGSRYLSGGTYGGQMPFYRKIATRIHPWLLGLFCGRDMTESTNGFRAIKVSILDDPRIDLSQGWLDNYELEVYLLMKLLKLKYKVREVPCSKLYPPKSIGNTKMRPVLDWWKMLRPIFYVGLGLRS